MKQKYIYISTTNPNFTTGKVYLFEKLKIPNHIKHMLYPNQTITDQNAFYTLSDQVLMTDFVTLDEYRNSKIDSIL